MQIADRIEQRRFVGREFLLFLWFESEAFEATLSTRKHGSFGLWLERLFVLSAGVEGTRIKGSYPGGGREAKEALASGKLPESAGLHASLGEREITFTLKAESLAVSGLALPTVLGGAREEPAVLLPPARRKRKPAKEQGQRDEEGVVEFHERMRLTREVEELVEELYREFLELRLAPAWERVVTPALRAWMEGQRVDADRYRKARNGGVQPARSAKRSRMSALNSRMSRTPSRGLV